MKELLIVLVVIFFTSTVLVYKNYIEQSYVVDALINELVDVKIDLMICEGYVPPTDDPKIREANLEI